MTKFYWMAMIVALAAPEAFAVPVTWTLSGVVFGDGGTASGSFVYDADTGVYSSINITTTTGTSRSGATYHFSSSIHTAPFLNLNVTVGSGDLTGTPALYLVFAAPLTNTGGPVALVFGSDPDTTTSETACSNATCDFAAPLERLAIAGLIGGTPGIITTPAPPTWTLVWIGLMILGATMMVTKRTAFRA